MTLCSPRISGDRKKYSTVELPVDPKMSSCTGTMGISGQLCCQKKAVLTLWLFDSGRGLVLGGPVNDVKLILLVK